MSTAPSTAQTASPGAASPWIVAPRWDLSWLVLSGLLVAVPPVAHTYWRVGSSGIDILVTALIGGPHMYATFLRTVFEPRFRERHPLLAWAPVIGVPIAVTLLSAFAFEALLSFFFVWASIHICDQASYIASMYRSRSGAPVILDRLLDFLVTMAALYVVAIHRFVAGTFVIAGHTIWFPPVLMQSWVPRAFAAGAAALIATWAVRSWNQFRAGKVGAPYILFMSSTMGVAFVVPMMKELSVSFQGFNAWHSFQYLGLTFLALNQTQRAGRVTLGFVRNLASPGRFIRYYGWNVLLTLGAGVLVALATLGLRLPMEQSYYTVVLSFLLVHYFHDHVLFSAKSEAVLVAA